MRIHHLMLLACLLLAACSTTVTYPPAPVIPVGALGTNQDSDTAAVLLSAYTFGDKGRLTGNPIGVAWAAASVEYLAGALPTSPRWQNIAPYIIDQMIQAGAELNQALGVAPGAPAQAVVDGLLNAASALLANDPAAAAAALNPAVFTFGPQQTLNILGNMPFLPITNIATLRLNNEFLGPNGSNTSPRRS
jgi:hypothetical protein